MILNFRNVRFQNTVYTYFQSPIQNLSKYVPSNFFDAVFVSPPSDSVPGRVRQRFIYTAKHDPKTNIIIKFIIIISILQAL